VRGVDARPGGGPGTPFEHEGGGQIGLKEFVEITSLRIAKAGLAK
jgi:hypothetical protein